MHPISPARVTPALRALFRQDEPQARRCFAVLDGVGHAGTILTDDPETPTRGAVREGYDGVLYMGGRLDAPSLARVFATLRRAGDVLVGLWPDDPRFALLPPGPDYDGRALEFYDRPVGQGLEHYLARIPPGCRLRRLDRTLILRTEWGPDDVRFAGGLDAWERTCLGFCLMAGDEILCAATVGPPALGRWEPGVFTRESHRGLGYATLTAARLVQEIEGRGGRTYWNCAAQNRASTAVARKLGYRTEREYRCLMWSKTG